LHVLSTPPAFVLSQNQTLQKNGTKIAFRPMRHLQAQRAFQSFFQVHFHELRLAKDPLPAPGSGADFSARTPLTGTRLVSVRVGNLHGCKTRASLFLKKFQIPGIFSQNGREDQVSRGVDLSFWF